MLNFEVNSLDRANSPLKDQNIEDTIKVVNKYSVLETNEDV